MADPAAAEDKDEDEQGLVLNRIQTVVRVRPVLPHESSQQVAVSCSSDGSSVQVELPTKEYSKPAIAAATKPDAKSYQFDACLTGSTTQAELFDICGMSDLVDAAVDGYNVTVFAFGQTGSGKTFSIIGPRLAGMQQGNSSPSGVGTATPTDGNSTPSAVDASAAAAAAATTGPHGSSSRCSSAASSGRQQQQQLSEQEGLLARCVHQLYSSIAGRQGSVQCSVTVSCVELYNENVTDLLSSNKHQQLQVRQDPRTEAFYVDGLTQAPAQSAARVLRVLADALAWRHTSSHKLNSYSSRSHCLITLTVASQDVGSPGQELLHGVKGGMRRCGKLVLVDLAGSERLNSTGNSDVRESLKETGAINKSLFTLGQVLAALSVRGGIAGNVHVPYRDSRLTQLLWDGLRGGGRVLMLACLCPLKSAAEESLNTLHFASMALRIKATPVIMLDPQDHALNEMRHMIKTLQEDCKSLASALTQICTSGADMATVLQTLPPNLVQDALRYGNSSAPALDQQLRQRSPSKGHQQGSRRGLRGSGSLGHPKAIYMTKPSTADPTMRHSMPALLPYHTSSSNAGSRSPNGGGRQQGRSPGSRQQQPRQQQPWSSSLREGGAYDLLPPLHMQGSGRNSPSPSQGAPGSRESWRLYASPPRSINSMPLAASGSRPGQLAGRSSGAAALQGVGGVSLGPSTGAHLYPRSLRQELYQAWPKGMHGDELTSPLQRSAGFKPRWDFNSTLQPPPPRTSQLVEQASISASRGAAAGAADGAGMLGSSGHSGGGGGIWGLPAGFADIRRPQQPEAPSIASFPELAAMEQQFQQQLQQQQQPGQGPGLLQGPDSVQPGGTAGTLGGEPVKQPFDVQLLGNSGVLLPSGLPASVSDPRSLVPVRIGVAETDCVGTSPDASPVAVALAAAGSQVRPIAVPLPADLTTAAAAAAAATSEAASAAVAAAAAGAGGAESAAGGAAVVQPDPQALSWAQLNPWFGADADMTRLAYEVHDMLVGEQGVDPTSQLYYTAIESHVAAAFPDKWAHWQQLMPSAGKGPKGRSSSVSPQRQPTYVRYKLQLKSPVPQQTGGQRLGRSMSPQSPVAAAGGGSGAALRAPTLSQLLQHPVLGTLQQQQQQHRDMQQLDRSLPQQLLQQYQQQHPQGLAAQLQQQHHQQQQQQSPTAAAAGSSHVEQQGNRQQQALPQLQPSVSPQPPGDDEHQQQQQQQQQRGSHNSPTAGAGALGLLAAGSSLGLSSTAAGLQQQPGSPHKERSHLLHHQQQQHNQQQQLQQQPEGSGLWASRSSLGGISAAASKVLQASAPSWYDGSGPLTSGSRPAWNASSQQGRQPVQAGADLAQVLRAGLNPGNKSLAELQTEYRQARALVLDRLRQQKEAAEVQRKQILLQLGRAISNSAWRA